MENIYIFLFVSESHVQTQTNNMSVHLSALPVVALSSQPTGSYWGQKSLKTPKYRVSFLNSNPFPPTAMWRGEDQTKWPHSPKFLNPTHTVVSSPWAAVCRSVVQRSGSSTPGSEVCPGPRPPESRWRSPCAHQSPPPTQRSWRHQWRREHWLRLHSQNSQFLPSFQKSWHSCESVCMADENEYSSLHAAVRSLTKVL